MPCIMGVRYVYVQLNERSQITWYKGIQENLLDGNPDVLSRS